MAERSSKSVLSVGGIETPILLWRATGSPPKEQAWDLEPISERIEEAPVVFSDPLAAPPMPTGEDLATSVTDALTSALASRPARRRGVVREDGSFVPLDGEIAAIAERTRLDGMRVVAFVSGSAIPRAWVVGSYYVGVGEGGNPRLLKAIRTAMSVRREAAVVKWTKSSKQALGVLAPGRAGSLTLVELAWREDVREVPARALSFDEVALTPDEVTGAMGLVEAMHAPISVLDELRDDARVLRGGLFAAAREGRSLDVAAYRDPAERESVPPLALGEGR